MGRLKDFITKDKESWDIVLDHTRIDEGFTNMLILWDRRGQLFEGGAIPYHYGEKLPLPHVQLANDIYRTAHDIGIMGRIDDFCMKDYKYIQLNNGSKILFKKEEKSKIINDIYDNLLDAYEKQVQKDKEFLTTDVMYEFFGRRDKNKHKNMELNMYYDPSKKWCLNYKWLDQEIFNTENLYYYQQHCRNEQVYTEGSYTFPYMKNQLFDEIVIPALVETVLNWQEGIKIDDITSKESENVYMMGNSIAINFENKDKFSLWIYDINIYKQIMDMIQEKQKKVPTFAKM